MVNLKGVVNLGVKIRLLEIAVLLNWKLKIPSSEWPLRRCQNAIRDYFQALRLIKLISRLKISKSTEFLRFCLWLVWTYMYWQGQRTGNGLINLKWISGWMLDDGATLKPNTYLYLYYSNLYYSNISPSQKKCSLRCLSGDKADFWPDSPVGSLDQFLMERVRSPYFFSRWMLQRKKTLSILHWAEF